MFPADGRNDQLSFPWMCFVRAFVSDTEIWTTSNDDDEIKTDSEHKIGSHPFSSFIVNAAVRYRIIDRRVIGHLVKISP
jgi:hypothetical protein